MQVLGPSNSFFFSIISPTFPASLKYSLVLVWFNHEPFDLGLFPGSIVVIYLDTYYLDPFLFISGPTELLTVLLSPSLRYHPPIKSI